MEGAFSLKDAVFLIDNAPYHRSKAVIEAFGKLGLRILFLGPY